MCEGCGRKPQAYHDRRFCYDCKPGSKGRPRPCRRCGSTGDYWSSGLCRRCHQYAPQRPESCRDCLAWGALRIDKWLCRGCRAWREKCPDTLACIGCRGIRLVNQHGACRLCWLQARTRARQDDTPIDVIAANRHGQQLMLANTYFWAKDRRPRLPAAPPPVRETQQRRRRYRPDRGQLNLFAYRPVEDGALRYGFGDPPNLKLSLLLDRLTCEHAAAHGWHREQTTKIRVAVRVLQAMRNLTQTPILASDVVQLISVDLAARPVIDILAANDLLIDDRVPTVQIWFDEHIEGLPAAMDKELRFWFDILHRGSSTPPRSRPRADGTIRHLTRSALPTLRAWADDGHRSLREITREQVLAVLPASGTPRVLLGRALISIFGVLKRHKIIFVNPTARIVIGNFDRRIPMPVDIAQARAAFTSADPVQAALTALIGIHGLRVSETCNLQLTDVRDGRLYLPDRTIVVARSVKTRLDAYLGYRAARWPNSANPHLFIHYLSAGHLRPVGPTWVNKRVGMSPNALRQDRIVDETQATGGDLRRICDFFGVTMATAEHYARTLNHPGLADAPPHTHAGSRTQGPD